VISAYYTTNPTACQHRLIGTTEFVFIFIHTKQPWRDGGFVAIFLDV